MKVRKKPSFKCLLATNARNHFRSTTNGASSRK